MPMSNEKIIQIVRELLLKEPKYQYPSYTAQFCWRAWQKLLRKDFHTITLESFTNLWKLAGAETLLRARRSILGEIKNPKADEQRHKLAEEYRNFFANQNTTRR